MSNYSLVRVENDAPRDVPNAVLEYNRLMGAVDRGDHLLADSRVKLKSFKLWKKIMWNMFVTASGMHNIIVNALSEKPKPMCKTVKITSQHLHK